MSSSSIAYKHFQRAFAKWPKDALRPNCQLQDIVAKRIEKRLAERKPGLSQGEQELKQANALYSLLEDRYKTKYRLSSRMLEPQTNPTYYKDIIHEIEEAPTRTFLQRMAKRLGGMIRLQ